MGRLAEDDTDVEIGYIDNRDEVEKIMGQFSNTAHLTSTTN